MWWNASSGSSKSNIVTSFVFRLPESQQRIGGFFLSLMPQMKIIYVAYCSNHPFAVNVLTQHRYSQETVYTVYACNTKQGFLLKTMWIYFVFICVCLYHSEELGEYMESKGASTPGILTLTTSLSKPFTRLERYPTLLKELDRHMEVSLNLSVCDIIQINQSAMLATSHEC